MNRRNVSAARWLLGGATLMLAFALAAQVWAQWMLALPKTADLDAFICILFYLSQTCSP